MLDHVGGVLDQHQFSTGLLGHQVECIEFLGGDASHYEGVDADPGFRGAARRDLHEHAVSPRVSEKNLGQPIREQQQRAMSHAFTRGCAFEFTDRALDRDLDVASKAEVGVRKSLQRIR